MSTESPSPTPPTPPSSIPELNTALATIESLKSQLAGEQRSRQIEQALAGERPVDAELAASLVASMMARDGALTPAKAVADLKRRAPGMFGPVLTSSGAPASGSMSATSADAESPPAPGAPNGDVLRDAARGDRQALLRYLRARRQS